MQPSAYKPGFCGTSRQKLARTAGSFVTTILLLTSCGEDAPTYAGPPIALVTVTAATEELIIGSTLQLGIEVRNVNGDIVNNAQIQWTSRSPAIATVSGAGLVSTRGEGIARIVASAGTVKDSVDITVTRNLYDVITSGEVFIPFSLNVPQGETVRFVIFDDEHDVEFDNRAGAPADIPVVRDVIVPRTFSTKGTFPYVCNVHPGMVGQIIVD
jgi:plastocyanin